MTIFTITTERADWDDAEVRRRVARAYRILLKAPERKEEMTVEKQEAQPERPKNSSDWGIDKPAEVVYNGCRFSTNRKRV